MSAFLALTVIGPDRPGLVEALAATLKGHGANWEESRMARLAGQFAGILLVSVEPERLGALREALEAHRHLGLTVVAQPSRGAMTPAGPTLDLELIAQDRPGIVREVAGALAGLGVSIDEFQSAVEDASWSGERHFRARASLTLPLDLPVGRLRQTLEGLANELMVDITLGDLEGG